MIASPTEDKTAALRRWMAVDRLRRAASALLAENAEVAQTSYQNPMGGSWSDAHWLRADRENAKLCIELRRALKEMDRCFEQQRVSKHD